MKDKGAEFPKKPCVQIQTNVLQLAVNNAKSRRAPRSTLLKTTAKHRREKQRSQNRYFSPWVRSSHTAQKNVSFCKRSSKKHHPYSICKDACTRRTTISASLTRNIPISISLSYRESTQSYYLLSKGPTAEQDASATRRMPSREALLCGRKQPS